MLPCVCVLCWLLAVISAVISSMRFNQFQISKLNGIEKSDALIEIVRHDYSIVLSWLATNLGDRVLTILTEEIEIEGESKAKGHAGNGLNSSDTPVH